MKKNMTAKIWAILLMLCVLCTGLSVSVLAEETDRKIGSIHIKTAPFAAGTNLAWCKVGTYQEGAYILDEPFNQSGADMTNLTEASASKAAAEKLTAVAKEKEELSLVGVMDENGAVTFSNIDALDTLYLAYQINNEDIVRVSPMLIVLPYYSGAVGVLYTADILAKYEDVRVTPVKGAVILNKVDSEGKSLAGAAFRAEKKHYFQEGEEVPATALKDDQGSFVWKTLSASLSTNQQGQIVIENLPVGAYRFIETKAPAGFILDTTPVEFVIDKPGTIRKDADRYVKQDGDPVILTIKNKPEERSEIIEESSTPETSKIKPDGPPTDTGDTDSTKKYIIIGVVVGVSLVAVILLFVLGRKKKDREDDEG